MERTYNAYELFFSDITTPYNLLENHKLDNYDYVKYYTEDDTTICEMQCDISGIKTVFYYIFYENRLMRIERNQYADTVVLFDRNIEQQKYMEVHGQRSVI